MKIISFVCGLFSFLLSFEAAHAQRIVQPLVEDWKFIRQDQAPDADPTSWEKISVPHTWNAKDGQNGKAADPGLPDGYYRGPAWYSRELQIPADWKGKRIFVRFEAASLVADVWLNGQHLGQHRGGYTAFCFEITSALNENGKNLLKVKVDNSRFDDVIPLSGDFTVFGGLCRPVELIVTDSTCITPLDHGSSGVFLTQKKISDRSASLEIGVNISNALKENADLQIQAEWMDADGKTVQEAKGQTVVSSGSTASIQLPLTISQPRLWQGRKDPYLYQARVRLLRDGVVVDEVTESTGLRSLEITNEKGFLLNGKPYALHGVNWHEERLDKGRALSERDLEEDNRMIVEIGATALRLAHYPQRDYFLSLCDRAGLVLWEEIPVVERINASPEFAANAKLQLKEMILQGYNHPSLAFWGIYNELLASWLKIKTPVDPVALLTELAKEAQALDPSRPVVGASWTTDKFPMHLIPQWQAYNTYPGWYWGKPNDFASVIEKGSAAIGGKRTAISEYGAGANMAHHEEGPLKQPKPDGSWHPEEWQSHMHEVQWAQAKDNPKLWGTFVWAMFDFASDGRNEGGTPGVNDKGIVSHDHKTPKDSFYFYQANWSEKPMVHIASSRMTPRKKATTEVKVYSNCEEVELKVNGKSQGKVKPGETKISLWKDVSLQPGKNTIEAVGQGSSPVTESCEWILTPE